MAAMRRIVLLATLLGSVLSGYVFFTGSASAHAASGQTSLGPCGAGPFWC
jgi:hypothetical protein